MVSDTEIIKQIQLLGEELGRTPTAQEFGKDDRVCHDTTVRDHFGSWNSGVEAAGYEPNSREGNQQYTDEEIVDDIRMMVHATGHIPKESEFDACPHVCSYPTVVVRFGSWNNAVREAGFVPRYSGNYEQGVVKTIE